MKKENYPITVTPETCGINLLTGEACAYSMRILCDLNEAGAQLIREYFGLHYATLLADNWNSTVDGQPAIASIMLDRDAIPRLLIYAALRQGFGYVFHLEHSFTCSGFNQEDVDADVDEHAYLRTLVNGTAGCLQGDARLYRNPRSTGPQEGGRNVHAFTGRSI